ncbi:MAG: hypothetical protein AAGB15_06045 [Pseudomonadota bacterium]
MAETYAFKPADAADREIAALHRHALQEEDPTIRARILAQMARQLNRIGAFGPAYRALNQAAVLAPSEPDVLRSVGLAEFGRGRWEEGLALYDRGRWQLPAFEKFRRAFPHPEWQGEPIQGKRLLVWAEQGIGDQVMHARVLPRLAAMGAKITLESDPRLHPLAERLVPDIACHTQTVALPEALVQGSFDYHGSMFSAWRWAGIQRSNPGYLLPNSSLVEAFRSAWARQGWTVNVGLSWRSRAAATGAKRSLPEELLAMILPDRGWTYHTLQYDADDREVAVLSNMLGHELWRDQGTDPTKDIDRLAALIAALDLVISIDNSTVHLAGALGTECWAILPAGSDWRWGPEGDETPLYDRVRLFRHGGDGAWSGALSRVSARLENWEPARRD